MPSCVVSHASMAPPRVSALREACLNALRKHGAHPSGGEWDVVVSSARTLFESCVQRSPATDGPHAGDRLHWCVCSAALFGTCVNPHLVRSRPIVMKYVVDATASSDSDRRTVHDAALFFACIIGTPNFVAKVLEAGANANAKASVEDGGMEPGFAVPKDHGEDWTPLMYAATGGRKQCALELLKAGAAVDHAAPNGRTALMLAAVGNHEQCVLVLIKAGADLEAHTLEPKGFTALMLSCHNGHEQCVLALIKAGVNLESKQNQGFSALMLSCERGHEQCALALIQAGAAVDAADSSGFTSLMQACGRGHEGCALALLRAGANVNYAKSNGFTALMLSAQNGQEQCVLALIKAGANVDHFIIDGRTALMQAAKNGHAQCVRALLAANANPEAQVLEPKGFTALMLSCIAGHAQCARALLEAGAAVDATLETGGNALRFACVNGNLQCLRLLMSYTAHHHFATDPERIQALPSGAMQTWVEEAVKWSSPLHFVDVNPPERTLSLLRDGANINASFDARSPTPLDVALGRGGASASLILRAGYPWSFGTHFLFPLPARRRAYDLFKIGRLFAASRFAGEEQAFLDAWDFGVMPHAIARDEGEATAP